MITEELLSLSYEELKKFQEHQKQLELICHQLLQIIQACSDRGVLPYILVEDVEKVVHKLQSQRFRIAIVGEFSRGKSTLVNALVGEKIQPVRAIACSGTVTVLKHGSQKRIVCHYRDGRKEEISFEQYQDKVTLSKETVHKHRSDELASSEIEEVIFEHPNLLLCQNGVEIVDSPGLNEHPARAAVTHQLLKNADAVIFLTIASQALSQGEREIIRNLIVQLNNGREKEPANNLFILVNKIDELDSEKDRQDVQNLVKEFAYGENPAVTGNNRVHFISAKAAFNTILEGKYNEYLESFRHFTQSAEKFLTTERGYQEIEQYTTKLKGFVQSSVKGLAQAEDILDGKVNLSEAERQKILEQIGEVSGRDIKIHNLANQLKKEAIEQANVSWANWYDGLSKRMSKNSKNWCSENSHVFKQKQLIKDYVNQFIRNLSQQIDNWGNKQLNDGILKDKLQQLDDKIHYEFKAIQADFKNLDYQVRHNLSEQLKVSISGINDDFMGVGGFGGGIGIGGALAAGLVFLTGIGIVAVILASVAAAIAGSFGLGMLDVDGLNDKIKLKVCEVGLKELDKSKDKFSEKRKEIINSVFDKRVESASRVIAQAISLYENLLNQQEKAHQETLEQREAEKAWIAEKRQELEQVQKGIEAIMEECVG